MLETDNPSIQIIRLLFHVSRTNRERTTTVFTHTDGLSVWTKNLRLYVFKDVQQIIHQDGLIVFVYFSLVYLVCHRLAYDNNSFKKKEGKKEKIYRVTGIW